MVRTKLCSLGLMGVLAAPAALAQTGDDTAQEAGGQTQGAAPAAGEMPGECRAGGMVLLFETGSDQLSSSGRASLDAVASWAQDDQQRKVRLEGFDDRRGPESLNERLSEQRAEAARDYLIAQGVPTR